jgi:thiamine pyrophosphate-dependent acetolactate synthase large subunit-like protein
MSIPASNANPTPGIPYAEAVRAVNYHRNDSLVVSTSAALREWSQVSERRELDLDLMDCMDRAPAVGLGLALAQPSGRVLVLDCDATLRTNLGGLATIGESRPSNLVHFVFDDASRSSTGGLPIKELDHLDLVRMAESSGYAHAYHFDRLEELLIGLEEAMEQDGPVFILVSVYQDGDSPAFPERSMADGWARVRERLTAPSHDREASGP